MIHNADEASKLTFQAAAAVVVLLEFLMGQPRRVGSKPIRFMLNSIIDIITAKCFLATKKMTIFS